MTHAAGEASVKRAILEACPRALSEKIGKVSDPSAMPTSQRDTEIRRVGRGPNKQGRFERTPIDSRESKFIHSPRSTVPSRLGS
jgi:hypothetical protein